MKRDCDLVRQILLAIEHRGATCPLDALRADLRHESDERIRYHLQLVIDAGWVAEVERSVAGPLGVRLTQAGHEFVELARGDVRWRAAKAVVIEETRGLSLGLLRALLAKWAWRTIVRSERIGRLRRPRPRVRSPRVPSYVERVAPTWWEEQLLAEPASTLDDDQVRILHRRRRGRKRLRSREGIDAGYFSAYGADLYGSLAEELDERRPNATLPPHVI